MIGKTLKVYCDGGARGNPGPAAAAFVVVSPKGRILAKKGFYIGRATNNSAEYYAVLAALQWVRKNADSQNRGVFKTKVFLDSQLVTNQLSGKFKIRKQNLKRLAMKIKELEKGITGGISYYSVPRNKNRLADFLVNQTLDSVKKK